MNKSALGGLLFTAVLSGCGGGGGSDASNSPGTAFPQVFAIDPATVTLTAKTTNDPFYVASEYMAYEEPGAGRCYALDGSTSVKVFEAANTVTYASAGTSEADQQQIARYAEAAVQTMKATLQTPASTPGLDGNKIRVCADSGVIIGNGSAGARSFIVSTVNSPRGTKSQEAVDSVFENGYEGLKRLVLHEMVHVGQKQLLQCISSGPSYERWFLEGMALRIAGQDEVWSEDLAEVQAAFSGATPTPFHDINNNALPSFDRYSGYRLAIDALLGETGKQNRDLFAFLDQYGSCPTGAGDFKSELDNYFGSDVRGTGALGDQFWSVTAPKYTVQ